MPQPQTIDEYRAALDKALAGWTEAARREVAARQAETEALVENTTIRQDRDRMATALERIRAGEVGWRAIAALALDQHGMDVGGGL